MWAKLLKKSAKTIKNHQKTPKMTIKPKKSTQQNAINTLHCCYQRPFQEVNIPMNRALLPNCKIESTACLFKKKILKNWAFKKMLRQIGITRNARGHNLQKKVFLFGQYLCQKMAIFFLKLPFFTTKWPEGLSVFGPELPTGVMKIDF